MHAAFEERGLRELPLPEPEVAFTGDETFTQHGHVHAGTEVLDVILGIREQDLLDEVRMAGEEDASRPEAKARDVAVGAGDLAEEIEPLRHEGLEAPADEGALGARRQPGVRDGIHAGIIPFSRDTQSAGRSATSPGASRSAPRTPRRG